MSTTSRIRLTDRSFRPVLAGATVAVAGFGALFVFWIVGDWRSDVPGLFFYRSATIGDGLLLPLVVGVLYATVCDDELASPAHERGVGLAAAAVGAIAGGTTQAVWLTDPSPAENWSFPRAHHFNSAGWYHAVFLTSAGALLCLLTVSAARRIRTARLQGSPRIRILARSRWLAVLFGASVSLVGLIAIDNRRASHTAAGTTTTIAIAFSSALFLGLLAWAFGSVLRDAAVQLLLGALVASALCLALA